MQSTQIRGLVFSALFAALTIAMSYLNIKLSFTPVPIVLTTMGVMLAGTILGARYGFLSMVILIALDLTGMPLLGGKPGGVAQLLGPTGGYIVAWPFAAYIMGWLTEKISMKQAAFAKLSVIHFVGGALFVYIPGVAWLMVQAHIPTIQEALIKGMYPFLIGDAVKAIVAAVVVVAVQKVYPQQALLKTGQ